MTASPPRSGRRSRISSSPKPSVLISGASSGIGAACARRLAAAGWEVYAGAAPPDRVAQAIEHALTARRPKIRYLVGRDARIRAAIERLPDRLRDRVLTRALLGG